MLMIGTNIITGRDITDRITHDKRSRIGIGNTTRIRYIRTGMSRNPQRDSAQGVIQEYLAVVIVELVVH